MFRRLRHNDDGATDPILVIAAIAVSLILLVGGSFAVSGMIGNAKDLNARDQLQKIAVAEAALQAGGGVTAAGAEAVGDGGLVFTGSGSYLNWKVTKDGTVTGDKTSSGKYLNEAGAVGFTPAEGVATEVVANDTGWVAGSLSQSGKQYWMSSTSSTIYNDTIPAGKYDAALTPPTLQAPYNAVAECPAYNSTTGGLDDGSGGVTALMTQTGSDTAELTVTAAGSKFCPWARVIGLNLAGGDHFTGVYPSSLAVNLDGQNSFTANTSSIEMTFASEGTALTATRTATFEFKFDMTPPFQSLSDWVKRWNDVGGDLALYPTTGKQNMVAFVHYGPYMYDDSYDKSVPDEVQ